MMPFRVIHEGEWPNTFLKLTKKFVINPYPQIFVNPHHKEGVDPPDTPRTASAFTCPVPVPLAEVSNGCPLPQEKVVAHPFPFGNSPFFSKSFR